MRVEGAIFGGPDHFIREEEQRQLALTCRLCKHNVKDKAQLAHVVSVSRWNVPRMAGFMEDDVDEYHDHERCVRQELDHASVMNFKRPRARETSKR